MDWIISWVVCWIAFMSVFFSSWNNYFEKLARHFLDTLLSVELFKPFSYRNPNSSLIPGGSIENAPASSIAPRHLVDRSSFCSWIGFLVSRYFLDTLAINDLFSTLTSTASSTPLDTSSIEHYWRFYFYILCDSFSHFFDLSRSVRPCSSPKHFLFHSQPLPQDFFKLFQVFLHLVSF